MSHLEERIRKLSPEKRALLEKRMKAQQPAARVVGDPVAVIGIGCRFPGDVDSPRSFWNALVEGRDCIDEIPPERWSVDDFYDPDSTVRGKMATRWGGFLKGIEEFDPGFFDITFREALHMDPQQRLFIESAWEALEDAGLVATDIAGSSTGVFISAHNLSSDYYVRQWAEYGDIDAYSATGGAHSIIANRLSYWLDLQGPSLVVDTACSASLVATHLAFNSLASGECDLAIAGGVNLIPSPDTTIALSGLQMMAADGRCKTFDQRADGFVRGEGCGAVVLKRLSDARRDGDPIYALIRGSAVNQDGRTNGLTAPNGLSQQKVLRQALKRAGVDGSQVGYVEAHGTGTALGDPIEIEALTEVMGRPADGERCVIGAVKTNIGHLESASGIAGFIKAVLTLHNGYIAPNLHFTGLNPHITLDGTRFALANEGMSWPADGATRFAGVSSFGFGGTNAHIVLEEAPRDAHEPVAETLPSDERMLTLSAREPAALRALAERYVELLKSGELDYADVCYTAACRRTHHEHRLVALVADADGAADTLGAFLAGESPPELIKRSAPGDGTPRTAWVFSGQGSQRVGMGRALLDSEPVFRETIERIDATFAELADWSLLDAILTADVERLAQTEVAQPAIFAVEVGLAAVLRHYGVRPDMLVGHSLGEVAAACVGGALDLEEAVTVIYHRGRLMQRLHGAGCMAAVFAPAPAVRDYLGAEHAGVSIAAVNGPHSVTISGEPAAVDRVLADIEWQHQRLPVEYAFHSEQMESLKAEFAAAIGHIKARAPSVSLYSTVRGGRAERDDFGPDYWLRNIREPVDFAGAIGSMAADGASCFVELGPQAVLGTPIEQCLEATGREAAVLGMLLRDRPERTREILAGLHANGLSIDWRAYFPHRGHAVRLPTYPWQRRRCWFDPRSELAGAAAAPDTVDEWCYDLAWPLRTPLDGWIPRGSIDDPPSLERIADSVAARRDAIYERHDAEDSVDLVTALEQRALGLAVAALRQLGFPLRPGDRYGDEDITAVAQGYRQRVVSRLFRLLADHGAATIDGSHWAIAEHRALGEPVAATPPDSTGGAEIFALLERCGEQVAAVVSDRCDPLSLLFPGDYATSAEWVYADAPISKVANDMLGEVVDELVRQLPESRPLRILEIGAGTGGSTRKILPRLPPDRTEYVFTDLSTSFLNQASERFADDLPLSYALLDLEADPSEQGFAPAQFDLVIAANVVHATADLKTAVSHARELLAPGGVLLMLEGTARRGWIDLTFGLTEGWWRFTDTDVRSDHPLLGGDAWRQLLSDNGFIDVCSIPAERDAAGCLFEQAILLARAPAAPAGVVPAADAPSSTAPWIVLGDGDGLAATLADDLHADGIPCVRVEFAEGEASFSERSCRIDASRPEDFAALIESVAQTYGQRPRAVIDLCGIDERGDGNGRDGWDPRMTRTCGGLLHLLQGLIAEGVQPECGVWVATRGVQPVMIDPDDDTEAAVVASPLWGLGRVAAREHPDLWGGMLDLDVRADRERDAATLRCVVEGETGENQIAIRGNDRFVARLVPVPAGPEDEVRLRGDRSYLIVGGLGGIGLHVARWMVERGARYLTLCGRSGLPSASDSPAAEMIGELEAAGASIDAEAIDVSDSDAMAALIAGFGRERPALAGVIHAAAVIDFRPLEAMSLDELLAALRAKVAGSWVLHELTADLELDFLLLFSSMAAIGGFPELGHYAAGNSFMDALAHRRRALGLPAMSINWGLWSDGRATGDDDLRLFERIGLNAMPSTPALEGLERLLGADVAQRVFAWVDWDTFRPIYEMRGADGFLERLGRHTSRATADAPAADDGAHNELRRRLEAVDPTAAIALLAETIADAVATILGVSRDEITDREDGFFQMGMDSIMTVELRRRLESGLNVNLPTTLAFEYPTIERLTEYLAAEVLGIAPEVGGQSSAADDSQPGDGGTDDLDSFSEAELAAELDRELAELGDLGGGTSR